MIEQDWEKICKAVSKSSANYGFCVLSLKSQKSGLLLFFLHCCWLPHLVWSESGSARLRDLMVVIWRWGVAQCICSSRESQGCGERGRSTGRGRPSVTGYFYSTSHWLPVAAWIRMILFISEGTEGHLLIHISRLNTCLEKYDWNIKGKVFCCLMWETVFCKFLYFRQICLEGMSCKWHWQRNYISNAF